jgi:hypothetical protein
MILESNSQTKRKEKVIGRMGEWKYLTNRAVQDPVRVNPTTLPLFLSIGFAWLRDKSLAMAGRWNDRVTEAPVSDSGIGRVGERTQGVGHRLGGLPTVARLFL